MHNSFLICIIDDGAALLQQCLVRRATAAARPRKGGQIRFSTRQTDELERRFQRHKYLSPPERYALSLF